MQHEHQRYDRDDYLTIFNATGGTCTTKIGDNLHKFTSKESITVGLPYDYCSISHYPTQADNCSLIPKKDVECNIKSKRNISYTGQTIGLSQLDKETIRRRYNCRGGCKIL